MRSQWVTAAAIIVSLSGCVVFNSTPALEGSSWRAVEIGGADVIDDAQSTLSFSDEGRIGGNGACNSMFGQYESDGDALTIHSIGSTKMACASPIMDQEMRYFSALRSVRRFSFDEQGFLILRGDDGEEVAKFSPEHPA